MIALHNSDIALSGQAQNHFTAECPEAFSPHVSMFHKVLSEVPGFPALTQGVSGVKVPSLLESCSKMVFVPPSVSLKSSPVLRI